MVLKIRYLLFAATILCYQPRCFSQIIQVDGSIVNDHGGGFFAQWDPVQEKLLLYRDISDPGVPAARMYAKDGTDVAIYPVRDIEGSWYVDAWGVAATPDGGMVLASVIGYTPRGVKPAQVKSALLTYDGAGKLKSFWEVLPYQHRLVAVDHLGDVFGLGLSDMAEPYPLIVKYSPTGKVLKEFFSTSLLAKGEKDLLTGSADGENQMFVAGNELTVWIAASKELFRFSLNGDLVARTQLSTVLNNLASSTGSKGIKVVQIAPSETGDLVAQVALWGMQPPGPPSQGALIGLTGDRSQAVVLTMIPRSSKFLWPSKEGKAIYLQYEPTRKMTTVAEH